MINKPISSGVTPGAQEQLSTDPSAAIGIYDGARLSSFALENGSQGSSGLPPKYGGEGQTSSGGARFLSESDREAETVKLYAMFDEFYDAYTMEWQRLNKCDKLYRCDHWDDVPIKDVNEPRPTTPVIQSAIENIRAELFDTFPKALITADDEQNEEAAEILTRIVTENHITCDYEMEYDRMLYDVLVGGYMVQEVGYDFDANGGYGGAYIRYVDNRCIMFDPLVSRIDDCRAIFKFAPYPKEYFYERYRNESERMNADAYSIKRVKDVALNVDDSESILLIECWRREYDSKTGRFIVHMQKLAGGVMLEDSRDFKPEGYYAHGKYPFVITSFFRRKGTVLGLGFADMFENQQKFSDKLDQIVMKNALMASHNKLLVTNASGFDVNDLRDWSKEVHTGDNINGVKWFSTAPLPAYIMEYINIIRNNVKRESGTDDFSRGTTFGGVTAASAIRALQEMSNKRSRMLVRALHSGFRQAVLLEIEVEREFAVFARSIGMRAKKKMYSREILSGADYEPIDFHVTVSVDRDSSAAIAAENDIVFKMVQLGLMDAAEARSKIRLNDKRQ